VDTHASHAAPNLSRWWSQARKPADGGRALSLAAQRVVATINWREGYTFTSPEELRSAWDDVVWW
jgi:hypothetical protein